MDFEDLTTIEKLFLAEQDPSSETNPEKLFLQKHKRKHTYNAASGKSGI